MDAGLAVFFDLGDTLVSPRITDGHLTRLEVYPFVPEILTRLTAGSTPSAPIAVGLISNTGTEPAAVLNRLLLEAGLSPHLTAQLCLFSSVEGLDKSEPALFRRAAERAGLPVDRCLFVGEDAAERAVAAFAGFRVSPHPLHALWLVERTVSAPS